MECRATVTYALISASRRFLSFFCRMVHYTELNFELELSASVLASSSEESSTSDTEVSSNSSNSCRTIVTSSRKESTNTWKRKREKMADEFDNDGGLSYDEWCSFNIDLPCQVDGLVPAEDKALEEPEETGSVDSEESVDLGSFSSSSSRGSSCDLSPEELARICIKGETGADLTEAQRVKFKESLENTGKYEKSKTDLFETFLGIIGEKGGKLSRLGTDIVEHEHRKVPALVKALLTAKDRSTRVVILDECLKLFAEFYRREDGSMFAPGSLKTFFKRLFATLRLDYRVDIKVKYFAKKGSFRSVSTVNMQEARKGDKGYGIKKGMSAICINDLEIVYMAIQEKKLQPKVDPYHLKLLISFILLRLYGLRAEEAANLEVDEVSFETYDAGPDKGKRFCQLKMDFDKTHKLKFGTPGIPENYGKLKIRDNPEDGVMNAFYFMEYYCGKLKGDVRTRRFLRRPIKRANFVPSQELVWFNSLVTSQKAVSNTYRELAPIIGDAATEFEDITAHGGRACLVTYSLAHGVTARAVMQQTRHMNESGLIPYKRVDPCTQAVFQNVLDGVFAKEGESEEKKVVVESDDWNRKSESEKGETYLDRKPAAVNAVTGEEGGSAGERVLASNVNSISDNAEVVKQLQQEVQILKAKMLERKEEGTEVLSSPAKKAKREDVEDVTRSEHGVARTLQVQSESLLLSNIVRENDEMRRMLIGMRYDNQRRMGVCDRQSPFPSSNSEHLHQFMTHGVVSPFDSNDPRQTKDPQQTNDRQQSNSPEDSRERRSVPNGHENSVQRPDPDTASIGSDGNGGREEGRRFPSVTVPCVIM